MGTAFAQLCMDTHPKGYTNTPTPPSLPQVGQPGLNITAVQPHSTKREDSLAKEPPPRMGETERVLLHHKPRTQPTVGPLSQALVLGKAPAWSHLQSHTTLELIPGTNNPGTGIPEVSRLKLLNLKLKMQHCRAARFCVVLVARIYTSKLLCCQEYNRRQRERNPLPGHSGDVPAIF